jgi:hypothetical protein
MVDDDFEAWDVTIADGLNELELPDIPEEEKLSDDYFYRDDT